MGMKLQEIPCFHLFSTVEFFENIPDMLPPSKDFHLSQISQTWNWQNIPFIIPCRLESSIESLICYFYLAKRNIIHITRSWQYEYLKVLCIFWSCSIFKILFDSKDCSHEIIKCKSQVLPTQSWFRSVEAVDRLTNLTSRSPGFISGRVFRKQCSLEQTRFYRWKYFII